MKLLLFCLLVTFSVLSSARGTGAEWNAYKRQNGIDPRWTYDEWVKAGMPGAVGNGGNNGPSAADLAAQREAAAQQQAAEAQRKLESDAHDLNQQGIDASNRGDDETASKYFQDALDKRPGDSSIQENIQNAKDRIAAKNQRQREAFDQSKQEGLNQLRGIAEAADFDSATGLKGVASANLGLREAPNSGDSVGLKTLSAVNTDPQVVDARKLPSGFDKETEDWLNSYSIVPGVADRLRKGWQAYKLNDLKPASAWFEDALNHDPNNPGLKFLVEICHGQQKLASSPAYAEAINQGITAYATGDVAGEHTAVEKIRKAEGVLVLPEDKDMELLDQGVPSVMKQEQQILNGVALPTKDAELNEALKEHPELRPQLLAAWKTYCTVRITAEDDAMAQSVKKLAATAASLGLPYGHIEETVAKDPKLKAQWQAAIENAAFEESTSEIAGYAYLFHLRDRFDKTVQQLRQTANSPPNPYELK